ncbi:hypothetical protein FD51_GL001322 [Lacticaseibacillus zeae DSM 20178 = KCTC 3804]|uniref:Uncharacterized protein n=1 Tax=Lacticaseibacillus zeae DSM 20178 = KCTC 3804 TaxID=1423816 RepID=A0A0R1EUT4_LACZE|nr:hypothetical protein FD51_GL001322 [Lacticaseibacillus zeae DSM 20178 = KCTC 3804]
MLDHPFKYIVHNLFTIFMVSSLSPKVKFGVFRNQQQVIHTAYPHVRNLTPKI